ncbi:MAG: ATP-binding protein [Candidatus Marinimicrobia bacterium]|nr:ATP-binding protein [Candidatus Neomarinimicrobiota bacterium]MCF7850330.1 ATP-binding protein [Candidatus Neomarinimicrobiota bacterium]MCF7904522.1 ATP-binding protein [Candidatus Neomarinimicrobiota bacterium]
MSKIYSNPFVWGVPVTGSRYLTRPVEEEQIHSCIEKKQPLVLTGYRGSGKTSMMQAVASKFHGVSMYLDLGFVVGEESTINLLKQQIKVTFPELKDDARLNSNTTGEAEAFASVSQLLFDHIKDKDKKLMIIWDEFQHVIKLKEDVLGLIKKNIAGRRDVMHVFISHREDQMQQTFGVKGDRFFPKTQFLHLENLGREAIKSYLTKNFRQMGLTDFDLPESIINFTNCQPCLTQKFAHAIARCWLEGTTTRLMERASKKLLDEEDTSFARWWDGFGVNEKRLFLGLANGYSRPTELGFIDQFGLSATSTAHNTVLKLLREGWLVNRDEGYYIYDPLFLLWLKNRNNIT